MSGDRTVTEDNQIPSSNNDGIELLELLSRCANCLRVFENGEEKRKAIVGKYPKLFGFSRNRNEEKNEGKATIIKLEKVSGPGAGPMAGQDDGNDGEEIGKGEQRTMDGFTVGVLEALLHIFGLPLPDDDKLEMMECWENMDQEGSQELCRHCHDVLTSFYNAFQEYVRIADEASYLSNWVKSLYENLGKRRVGLPSQGKEEGKEGVTTEVNAKVPKKRGRKPKRKLNESISVPVFPQDVPTGEDSHPEIEFDSNMEFKTDEHEIDHGDPDPISDYEDELDPSNLVELSGMKSSTPLRRTSLRTRENKKEPDFESVASSRRSAAASAAEKSSTMTKTVRATASKKRAINNVRQRVPVKSEIPEPPSETFQCKHCEEYFLSEKSLDKHLATEHNEDSPRSRCAVCDQFFPTVASLAKHIHAKHDKKFPCPDCSIKCANYSDLEVHFENAHNQPINLCKECGKSFTSSTYLKQHERDIHGLTLSTEDEEDVTKSEPGSTEIPGVKGEPGERLKTTGTGRPASKILQPGARRHHRFECDQCGKSYKKKTQLSIHILFHSETEPRFGCSKCTKKYYEPKGLRRHLLGHTMANPLACSDCDKVFVRRDHLKRHKESVHNTNRVKKIRMPKPKKEIRCSVCHKTYSRKEYLSLHMRIHTGEKPYMCSTCGKAFRDQRNYAQHVITHKSDRPFCCSICGLTFKRPHHLKDHEGTHQDLAKPFSCTVPNCGKTFRLRKHLNSHELVHEGSRNHACHVCGKAFNRKDNLRQHINNLHGKEFAAGLLDQVPQLDQKPEPSSTVTLAENATNANDSFIIPITDPLVSADHSEYKY